jgi:hypothetical protein
MDFSTTDHRTENAVLLLTKLICMVEDSDEVKINFKKKAGKPSEITLTNKAEDETLTIKFQQAKRGEPYTIIQTSVAHASDEGNRYLMERIFQETGLSAIKAFLDRETAETDGGQKWTIDQQPERDENDPDQVTLSMVKADGSETKSVTVTHENIKKLAGKPEEKDNKSAA